MSQLHQGRHARSRQRPPPALPPLDGVRIHSELLRQRLLSEAGGLADELEQKTGDEALAWSSVRLNPPLVRVAFEAITSAEPGCALSAAICLFLLLLSGRPELVLPVSGTANLLILTSHYDGPTQPNGPRKEEP
jgi:hypothetical protein